MLVLLWIVRGCLSLLLFYLLFFLVSSVLKYKLNEEQTNEPIKSLTLMLNIY